ncbi:MAG TPA: LytTR family DNA-binding domain-containing protein [Flavisolibacter sp.]|jgi:DNA-binding LytR/AlgR family response regulator|nr:LytTR family DNA-binding domain-containing protein [Flavisolibacter sp.]
MNIQEEFIVKKPSEGIKKKLILRIGTSHMAVNFCDIVAFYFESKIVFAIINDGCKYIAEQNLLQLQEILNPNVFFRVNRKCIINGNYIKSFKTVNKVRLMIEMNNLSKDYSVLVSQKRASSFKQWVYNL